MLTKPLVTTRPSINQRWLTAFTLAALFVVLTTLFYMTADLYRWNDWHNAWNTAHNPRGYDMVHFIGNPFSLLLTPHAYLPDVVLSGAINQALLVFIPFLFLTYHKVQPLAFLLVYTFPPYLTLLYENNIDWLPLAALMLPTYWLTVGTLAKPTLFGLILLKRLRHEWVAVVLGGVTVLVCTVLVFGLYPFTGARDLGGQATWNIGGLLFPYGVVIGLGIALWAWKRDDETALALSTPFFTPYIVGYSFGVWFVALVTTSQRAAVALWLAVWAVVVGLLWAAL